MINTLQNVGRKLFGTANDRLLKSMAPAVARINGLEPTWRAKTDGELRQSTEIFRKRLAGRETLDQLLPEAFAAVREAGRRFTNTRHYDVQLIGGMVLHRGMIAEMVTGEGKTLVATLAAYLNALPGKGVHVVTVNDYLAQRDCDWMAPIYRGLGLTVGAIQSNMSNEERHPNYACDITYGTNNEFGFDYLRDNMKTTLSGQVQGPLNFAIVDEVDSILIDEARTPLIISGSSRSEQDSYREADRVVRALGKPDRQTLENEYFKVEEKDHRVDLSEEGQEKVSELLGIDNIWSGSNMQWPHLIANALKAHHLYKREQHYTIKDGQVVIVDEFTGRLMEGRRWSDGLHQAVEAREERDGTGVKIKEESVTLATITLQNYFRLYAKLAGMTGTAMTEAGEFHKIYKLDVVEIPTNRPLIRHEHQDLIFGTHAEKYQALADEIGMVAGMGRPVLVGTTSIEKSDELSSLLSRAGFKLEQQTRALGDYKRHYVLNARVSYENQYREADIVAQAGRRLVPDEVRDDLEALSEGAKRDSVQAVLDAVTELGVKYKRCPGMVIIATNMAGRGTDILLGGNAAHFFYSQMQSEQGMLAIKHEQTLKKDRKGRKGADGAEPEHVEEMPDLFSEMHGLLTAADALPYPMKDPRALVNPKERDGTQRALSEAFLGMLSLTPEAFRPQSRETFGSLFEGLFDPNAYNQFFENDSTWVPVVSELLERTLNAATDRGPMQNLIADLVRLSLPIDTYIDRMLEIRRAHAIAEGKKAEQLDEVFETLKSSTWRARLRKAEEVVRDCLFNRLLVLSPRFFHREPLGLAEGQNVEEAQAPYWYRAHEAGGLHIIGTERHESRRIDNQLRGRCGRQGDPGSSQFFLCLEDDLMRIFAGDSMRKLLQRFGLRDGQPIQHKWVSKSVVRAQRKVEARNFERRKNLLEYDEVMDAQRKTIYTKRQCILEGLTEETNRLRYRALRIRRSALNEFGGESALEYDRWHRWWVRDQLDAKPLAEGDEWVPLPDALRQEHLHRSSLETVSGQVSRMIEEYGDPNLPAQEWQLTEYVDWFNREFSEYSEPITVEQLEAMPLKDIRGRLREQVLWQRDQNLPQIAKETAKMRRHDIVPYAKETFSQKYEITFDDDAMTAIDGADPKKATELFTSLYMRNAEDRREREVGRDRLRAIESRLDAATGGWDMQGLCRWVQRALQLPLAGSELDGKDAEEVEEYLLEKLRTHYTTHEKEMGARLMRFIEQYVMLQTIDSRWKDHLREMDYLRSAVAFSGYVQRDPKVEYKIRGFDNFEQMLKLVESEYTEKVFRARLVERDQLESLANTWAGGTARKDAAATNGAAAGGDGTRSEMDRAANRPRGEAADGPAQIRNKYREPKPNDLCPCGSGKKWKKCHMINGGVNKLPDDARRKLLVH